MVSLPCVFFPGEYFHPRPLISGVPWSWGGVQPSARRAERSHAYDLAPSDELDQRGVNIPLARFCSLRSEGTGQRLDPGLLGERSALGTRPLGTLLTQRLGKRSVIPGAKPFPRPTLTHSCSRSSFTPHSSWGGCLLFRGKTSGQTNPFIFPGREVHESNQSGERCSVSWGGGVFLSSSRAANRSPVPSQPETPFFKCDI